MKILYNESEPFCMNIEKLNETNRAIPKPSINSPARENQTETNISNYLERYLKLACKKIVHDAEALFESADQVKMNTIKIAYPIILIFGLLGNLLSLIIMLKIYRGKKRGEQRFLINLIALSIADLAVLTFSCFREYSDDVLEWRLRSANLFFCKFFYFNCYLFSCFSSIP